MLWKNKKAFFLRHTTCLPSSTSQLVWSGPCLGGSSSTTTSGGDPLPPPLPGGSSSTTTSRGSSSTTTTLGGPLPPPLPGDPLPLLLLRGVLFHHHFWGVPCGLSHNALIYYYRMPQCIMGKIHMGPPPPELDRLTDKHVWKHYLPTYYVCGW